MTDVDAAWIMDVQDQAQVGVVVQPVSEIERVRKQLLVPDEAKTALAATAAFAVGASRLAAVLGVLTPVKLPCAQHSLLVRQFWDCCP